MKKLELLDENRWTIFKTKEVFISSLLTGAISLLFILIVEVWKFSFIVSPQNLFLLDSVVLIADALLINICVFYAMPFYLGFGGEKSDYRSVLSSAFVNLPKVVLSYLALMLFAQGALTVFQGSPLPTLFVLVLFLWAPYLCAFEHFAINEKGDDEDEEELEDLYEDEVFVRRPSKLFSNKGWWELGFIRSVSFSVRHSGLAVSLVFSVWLVRVIPELLVGLSFDLYSSVLANILKVIAAWIGAIIVHLLITRALFSSLEVSQRDEFFSEEQKRKLVPPPFQKAPSGFRIAMLCVLVVFATVLWKEEKIHWGAFLEDMRPSVESISKKGDELLVKLKITDVDRKLRWFNPRKFRLLELSPKEKQMKQRSDSSNLVNPDVSEVLPQASSPKSDLSKSDSPKKDSLEEMLAALREDLREPSRVVVYDNKNKVLKDYEISPRRTEVQILMAFPLKRRKEIDPSVIYELSYLNPFGFKQVLLTLSQKDDGSFAKPIKAKILSDQASGSMGEVQSE